MDIISHTYVAIVKFHYLNGHKINEKEWIKDEKRRTIVEFLKDFFMIPTPGHSRGHVVYLYNHPHEIL